MRDFQVFFESKRDTEGYRIVAPEPNKAGGIRTILSDLPKGPRIVRRGGALVPIRPIDASSGLFVTFSELRRAQIPEFMSKYGPITHRVHSPEGEDVGIIEDNISKMKAAVEPWRFVARGGNPVSPEIEFHRVNAMMRWDAGQRDLVLAFKPRLLIEAMWLQFARAQLAGWIVRKCQLCEIEFAAGLGSGRRIDATYCSEDHQKRAISYARSAKPRRKT